MASEPGPPDWRVEIEAAVAAGRLTLDEAKTVLCLQEHEDGALVAPNPRYRAAVREILASAEIDVEAEITVEKPPPKAVPRAPERPRKGRKGRKRTQATSRPANRHGEDKAAQGTPSKPSKTPDERRIAWAWANQDEAAALLRANGPALAAYGAPQVYGPDADPQIVAAVASPDAQVLFYSAHLSHISAPELLQAAEKLGVLAHAAEHYRPNTRANPILPAAAAGAPAVHVREDRLPELTKLGPLQTSFGFVPRTPGHVLPVFVYNADRRVFEVAGNRGVPIPWRLWYEALLSAPLAAYGREARIAPTLRDAVQWAGWKRWEPSKHLEPLAESLLTLRNMAFQLKDELWFPLAVVNVPTTAQFDLRRRIQIRIDLPPGSRQGPQVDRLALRSLAPRSAPRYRGLLGLSAYWDKYGRGRGGADALATNSEANRWPVLTPETLRLMMFPDQPASAAAERQHRKRAVEHAKAMHEAGLIEMVPHGGGWRVYRPHEATRSPVTP